MLRSLLYAIEESDRDSLTNYVNSHFCDDEVSEAKDVLWSTAAQCGDIVDGTHKLDCLVTSYVVDRYINPSNTTSLVMRSGMR